jgi:hypothetical protein
MFILADFAVWTILICKAFGLGHTAVVFAKIIGRTIFGNRFRIAFRTAATITAFLTGRTVDAGFGIAITINTLTRTAIANIALVFFARAMFVITAFGAFGIQTVFCRRFAADFR